MQYLLTEEELSSLRMKKSILGKVQKEELQELCTLAANHIPIPKPWAHDRDQDPSPWGCILDKENDPWYCDDCPMDKLCPHPHKKWSK